MIPPRIWKRGNQILAENLTVKSTPSYLKLVSKSARLTCNSVEVISSQRRESCIDMGVKR